MQELGVHTEDLGYLKMSVYSPFWMVNKTGLTLEYKVICHVFNLLTTLVTGPTFNFSTKYIIER